jgi:TonB family protein
MSEKNDTQSLFVDDGGGGDGQGNNGAGHELTRSSEDAELRALLAHWHAPLISAALDERVLMAFREQTRRAPLWKRIFSPITQTHASPDLEVPIMKECSVCREEFADKFSFCPVDGTPLNELAAAITSTPPITFGNPRSIGAGLAGGHPLIAFSSGEYHLTIIEDQGITNRLREALGEVARSSRLTWPEFRRDPAGFVKRSAMGYSLMLWRFLASPNVAVSMLTAFVFVLSLSIGLVAMDRWRASRAQAELADRTRDDLQYLGDVTDIPAEEAEREKGAAGMNKGNGGGSKPKQEKPGGGGGGGREEQKPASFGKLPQASMDIPQVLAPDPNPPKIKNPSLPVAATIDADPMLFPTDTRPIPYGDPKSKSTDLSSGTGSGNGIGTGTGGGVGSGEGGGVGPGRGGNTGGGPRLGGGGGAGGEGGGGDLQRTFTPREVDQKARILSKPEPTYTEDARRNQISGTVILRAVFSSSGQVTNIRAVNGLPHGLTERAITAARQIRFSPAMKDGRPVSQYIQIEYNFNLY